MDPSFKQEVATLVAKHAPGLKADDHAQRAERGDAAKAAVQAAAERERERLHRELRQLEAERDTALHAIDQRVEEHRRVCADAILRAVFDAADGGSLASLVRRWRTEPSRELSTGIHAKWSELDARAKAQLGVGLGRHLVATVFIDSIVLERPNALPVLSANDYGCGQRAVEALGRFTRAQSPSTMESALTDLEHALIVVARRVTPTVVEKAHRERYELRRTNATSADLQRAQSAFDAQHARAHAEKTAREFVPPPAPPASRSLSWMR